MPSRNNKPFSSREFRNIYARVPRLTANLIIRTPKGVILSLRRLPSWKNNWHIPGGTVFYKETIEQAVSRIAKAELGIAVKTINILGYIEYPSEEKERGFGWTIGLAILCEYASGKLKSDADASDIRIFSQLPKNTISEEKKFIKRHWPEISRGKF